MCVCVFLSVCLSLCVCVCVIWQQTFIYASFIKCWCYLIKRQVNNNSGKIITLNTEEHDVRNKLNYFC